MKSTKLLFGLILLMLCAQCSAQNSKLNDSLIRAIDALIQKDYASLRKARELRTQYGVQSVEARNQDSISHLIQTNNVIEIDKILKKHGWPSEEEIGEETAYSLFAIIQHANKSTRPKYLPIIRKAVKNGKCQARYLAGIEDRIATDNNELQIYGDQVKFYPLTETFDVWPIIDPENVDKRRASIGLQPIAVHLKDRFNLDWNLEKQKERTKAFIEKKKKKK